MQGVGSNPALGAIFPIFITTTASFMLVSYCAEVDPWWTHVEYVPSAAPLGILWHAKDFLLSPEVDAKVGGTQLQFIWWLMRRSQISLCSSDVFRCFNDHFWTFGRVCGLLNHVSICSQLWHSVTPALTFGIWEVGVLFGVCGVMGGLY